MTSYNLYALLKWTQNYFWQYVSVASCEKLYSLYRYEITRLSELEIGCYQLKVSWRRSFISMERFTVSQYWKPGKGFSLDVHQDFFCLAPLYRFLLLFNLRLYFHKCLHVSLISEQISNAISLCLLHVGHTIIVKNNN